MEYLFIILILISLIIYVFLLFNRQIVNRQCIIKKKNLIEKYNKTNYSNFTKPNIEISNILNNFNSKLDKQLKVENPLRNYKYSKNNLEGKIKNYNIEIIGKVLNKINQNFSTRYKLINIETINRKIDIINNEEITVVFLIHEVDKFSTRKLVLNYFKNNSNNVTCNFIKSLHSLKTSKDTIKPTLYNSDKSNQYVNIDPKDNIYKKIILDNDMKLLKKWIFHRNLVNMI